jgi:hypothetical protein
LLPTVADGVVTLNTDLEILSEQAKSIETTQQESGIRIRGALTELKEHLEEMQLFMEETRVQNVTRSQWQDHLETEAQAIHSCLATQLQEFLTEIRKGAKTWTPFMLELQASHCRV